MCKHRRSLAVAYSLFLAVLLLMGSTTNTEAITLFQDNFDDGNTVGWSFIGSNQDKWIASGGVLQHGGGYDGTQAVALIGGILTPSVFTLEADVSVKSNQFDRPDWGHVGLAWGVDPSTITFNTSYLRTHQDRVTNWCTPYNPLNEFFLDTPGTTNGPTYHLRVDVDYITHSMTLHLDSFTTTFTGADFDKINGNVGGSIGLMSWSDNVTWDNVRLSTPVPLPGGIWLLGSACVALFGLGRFRRKA